MPKYGNLAPGSQKRNFSKFFHFCGKVSRFRKYGNSAPGSQKWNFSKKFIFLKMFPDFASNEPSTTPDIMFKSSYARKRDFGLLCPNMEIRPQAPKDGIFQKIFIFLWRSSNFASNEPSTTCRQSLSQVMQENILSKKLNLGLNFSIPSGGVTSPSLKGSMVGTIVQVWQTVMKFGVTAVLTGEVVSAISIALPSFTLCWLCTHVVVCHKYSAP